ncbi:MAG: acetyl-CoA carboxylase biotin carboxyl carrier protein [Gemmatimonadota bacterium]
MIDLDFLERLVRLIEESTLDSLEIERSGTRIRLAKSPEYGGAAPMPVTTYAPAPALAPAAAAPGAAPEVPAAGGGGDPTLKDITSPMVGTFYRAPAPDAPPYVDVGKSVGKGDTLCIIEAMKLMNEMECEIPGTIVEICVENAQPVEYGQILFRVRPG